MLRSQFSAAIVARPSGWLTSTFRMAICRDTTTPPLEPVKSVLPRWGVYGPVSRWGNSQERKNGLPVRLTPALS